MGLKINYLVRYSYEKMFRKKDCILQENLSDVCYVYVRGDQKYDSLREDVELSKFGEFRKNWCMKLPTTKMWAQYVCPYHIKRSYKCTEILIENIYNWFVKCLPQNVSSLCLSIPHERIIYVYRNYCWEYL